MDSILLHLAKTTRIGVELLLQRKAWAAQGEELWVLALHHPDGVHQWGLPNTLKRIGTVELIAVDLPMHPLLRVACIIHGADSILGVLDEICVRSTEPVAGYSLCAWVHQRRVCCGEQVQPRTIGVAEVLWWRHEGHIGAFDTESYVGACVDIETDVDSMTNFLAVAHVP